jgi:lycopene cyclase domain-containing protein
MADPLVPEYAVAAFASVPVVVALELVVLRTGLFRRPAYWLSLAIMVAFQVLVDGWLTKLSAPIVVYAPEHASGVRFPWDIPVEDFAFGFSLITLTLLLWERLERQRPTDRRARRRDGRAAWSTPRRPASPRPGPAHER